MRKNQQKPMRIKISPAAKYEWSCKEEGSWEDHGRPEQGHVFCLLTNHKTDILIHNKGEFEILIISARYHNGGWDKGESKAVDALMKAAARVLNLKYSGPVSEMVEPNTEDGFEPGYTGDGFTSQQDEDAADTECLNKM